MGCVVSKQTMGIVKITEMNWRSIPSGQMGKSFYTIPICREKDAWDGARFSTSCKFQPVSWELKPASLMCQSAFHTAYSAIQTWYLAHCRHNCQPPRHSPCLHLTQSTHRNSQLVSLSVKRDEMKPAMITTVICR